jgi:hypothetical protein
MIMEVMLLLLNMMIAMILNDVQDEEAVHNKQTHHHHHDGTPRATWLIPRVCKLCIRLSVCQFFMYGRAAGGKLRWRWHIPTMAHSRRHLLRPSILS